MPDVLEIDPEHLPGAPGVFLAMLMLCRAVLCCRTVDVGMPQLAMHSIREMCGVDDVQLAYRHFLAFFR
jgi:hypothetical protein